MSIAKAMYKKSKRFLITKAAKDIYNALKVKGAAFSSCIRNYFNRRGKDKSENLPADCI